ncbi:mandelate racemase/muconate lactonizing enzyme family protein [Hyunsoonleella sp. SJ7]|uniref:Mandelate racemase/muconate lactonizing enzyme family protein n=1 Tax=Hyunsoonleella aquatilis TaxID=2762758 RepID=A0A923HHX4_9FLAO|nr:mandelate racemase/muconate lactonizing enzyme family protein [Hyunsoonleella aquatilis]MBC3758687.1 mandelate racemase/muconate lactonizing enzyme family protein [Hyunsoonleella aquatilis]
MKTNRRNFIKGISSVGLFSLSYPLLSSCISDKDVLTEKITKIEFYQYNINIPRYFSFGTWLNRQHIFMKISVGDYYGWSEIPASRNNPDVDLSPWVQYVKQFKGLSVLEAQKLLQSQQVKGSKTSFKYLELMDMGLLDLAGRLQNKPSIELLDLHEKGAVPGLYCILHKDENKVREEAEKSLEQNLGHHMKFKMYGDVEVDLKLLRIIREVLGDDAVVISDVNKGYKKWKSLEELAEILNTFKENGLNAIEDPAPLSTDQWITLQKMTGDLDLIPDAPMRPAWNGVNKLQKGMGRIINLHPSTMGSFHHTSLLAKKVHDIGAKVMIGDDSLVGPACTAWQQIAIGAGATWVEAIEKEEDSKDYLACVLKSATTKRNDGYFTLDSKSGFGLELDEKQLKRICKRYIEV